jgi:hypothetical protein
LWSPPQRDYFVLPRSGEHGSSLKSAESSRVQPELAEQAERQPWQMAIALAEQPPRVNSLQPDSLPQLPQSVILVILLFCGCRSLSAALVQLNQSTTSFSSTLTPQNVSPRITTIARPESSDL